MNRTHPRLPWWVVLLLAYLAGITIIGKGPTYLGIPPLFWGEITMVLSLLLIAPWVKGTLLLRQNRAIAVAIVAFMALGAVETAVSFPAWRLNALRDAAVWYYASFFFVGLGLAAKEKYADRAWWWLRMFWMVSLVWNTADLLMHQKLSQSGPVIPWRGVHLFFNSTHEAGENLALGAIIVLCTTTLRNKPIWRLVLVPIALLGLGLFAIQQGRGMRLGIATGVLIASTFIFAPRWRPRLSTRLVTLSAVAVPLIALVLLMYPNKFTTIANLDRFEEADPSDPVGTANWRVIWWGSLYDAVMKTNPAFGLGFGESLHLYHPLLWSLQDDFVVRSPHNFNVTVFARMGFSGLAAWAAILVIGIGSLVRRTWVGIARGQPYNPDRRDEMAFWILMLVCTVVNSSFGVLMEGPVLGIWFWFALGFASGRSLSPGKTLPASTVAGYLQRARLRRVAAIHRGRAITSHA
jgi:hypothetical protein